MKFVRIAVALSDSTLAITSFLTVGRGSMLPSGAHWLDKSAGTWRREPTAQNIEDELARVFPGVALNGDALATVLTWRVVAESDLPDREYRDAWTDTGAAIGHDMGKAREMKRAFVRHARATAIVKLDGEWMKATGQDNKRAAADAEAKRQQWRDAPADPRIDAAQTIEELKAVQLTE